MENTFKAVEVAKDWRYDFRNERFIDSAGKQVSREDFLGAVVLADPETSGIGLSTLRRAVLTRSALEASERGELESLVSDTSGRIRKGLEKVTYSLALSDRQDADYLASFNGGDTAKAQALVDQAARAAGYTEKVFHGTKSKDFDIFQKTTGTGAWYGEGIYVSRSRQGAAWYAGKTGRVIEGYAKAKNPLQN